MARTAVQQVDFDPIDREVKTIKPGTTESSIMQPHRGKLRKLSGVCKYRLIEAELRVTGEADSN
jgi:hypothetical protein